MTKFRYVAVDHKGRYKRGAFTAPNFDNALSQLNDKGLWTIELYDQSQSLLYKEIHLGSPKVKLVDFTVFCRQLATMYQAGIKLADAVEILAEQTDSRVLRKVLLELTEEMKAGALLSEAAAKQGKIFNTIFINMVRAGEESGNLDQMLMRLAIFYEKEHGSREKVKSAMVYPAIMSVVMILVMIFMMAFVIPRYIANFQTMGLELPLATQIVIAISTFVQKLWYVLLLILLIPIGVITYMRRSAQNRARMDRWKLKLPIFGKLWHKQAIARFSRTFSTLYVSGLPILQVLPILAKVVGNEEVGKQIASAREAIEQGQSITAPFAQSPLFPEMVVQMMAIGEQTGQLDVMLEKVADFYEADVDAISDRLKTILEPLLILALSALVGGIVVAMLLPMFQILQNI